MRLICAGLPKTGTKSLASALRILGYTVYDIGEHWAFYMDEYNQALESKKMPDFSSMYANVDCVTDLPACFFFEEIFEAFPDAKVLLMIRDDEKVWVRSLLKTLASLDSTLSRLWLVFGTSFTPTGRKLNRHLALISEKKWKNPDKAENSQLRDENLKIAYREHNERVRSKIPADKLLVYNVKQGWEPLCDFLGVQVPDVPFPKLNVNSEGIARLFTHSSTGKKVFKEVVMEVTLIVLVFAVLVFVFWT